ncbi:hypothetical protein FRC10_004900 [Ceratobasidium sp. 414]|nr:hypothetical protein FRC10_004900 [Ceratobasidium sp. 414]
MRPGLNLLRQVVVNAVVLFWAMQGPASGASAKPQSIRFPSSRQPTPMQVVRCDAGNVMEMGAAPKISDVYPTTLLDYTHSREDFLSQGMTVSSSVCIPSLEEPEPALHSPHHKSQFGQHPWGTRSPLPPAGEQIGRSGSLRSYASTSEEDLARKAVQEYDIVKSAGTSRRSSVTPTPPTQ